MADDDRGADVYTLPMINLSPPGSAPDDDDVPTLPEPPDTAPPPEFTLPFHLPDDEEDDSDYDQDDAAGEMVAEAASGTGTPARATASMAMVTMAAIAVAALRGTWSVAAYLKARREHHDAVADKAREAADKQKVANAAQAAKGRLQSGPEFGRGAAKGGGRGGSSGGGSGRGTFGQQKPSGKGGGRTPASSGSAGAGGRGAGPKGLKGPGSRNDSGGLGRRGANGSGSGKGSTGSGSGKGSTGNSSNKPGTLGQMALARQKRKADAAKAQRQAAADERKADLADRASARRQAEKDADDRRKKKAEKRKAKLERAKAGDGDTSSKGPKSEKDDKTGKGKDDAEKVDLKKKPKDGDGTETDPKDDKTGKGKDDAEKVDLKKKSWWKRRSRRRKPGGRKTGPKTHRSRRKRGKRRSTDAGDMPGADGEWLKPPPGWDVEYSVTIEREPAPRRPRGAIGTGQKGLPAGNGGEVTPTRTKPKESPIVMGPAAGEVGDTQFVDADLTVNDLIEADEDMGEQILQGVDHMRVVASKCEGLKTGLENLYATCLQKKVPGVLVKWCIRLMERAGSVQDKAEALAASLPRGSEAILSARDVAIEADKRRADAVKDAGHVAPAEREYHDRSGV
ncbi:hypothetical protein FE633_13180 [Streptomyces montanus]|uniref:Uncharacterized protein n=1 Tax=Streptomyces montanus TaxID=2580423 RepID=A0A5R9G2D6_9ACTN|nr:hypothetical protein [Streptomyces montanus]TLS45715.1 hypothetical protein FE633_13180 [Streptomyces montanus]